MNPNNERLYGLPHAEVMQFDAAAVYETAIEPNVDEHDRRPWTIEEWTVHPSIYHVPSADSIIERVTEMIADDGEIDPECFECFDNATKSADVVAAVEAFRERLASLITYKMADALVTTHELTWDDNGEPLLDGAPLYVPAPA